MLRFSQVDPSRFRSPKEKKSRENNRSWTRCSASLSKAPLSKMTKKRIWSKNPPHLSVKSFCRCSMAETTSPICTTAISMTSKTNRRPNPQMILNTSKKSFCSLLKILTKLSWITCHRSSWSARVGIKTCTLHCWNREAALKKPKKRMKTSISSRANSMKLWRIWSNQKLYRPPWMNFSRNFSKKVVTKKQSKSQSLSKIKA